MTSLRKSQSGLGAIAILLVIVVIAVIGLAGYRVKSGLYNSNSSSSPSASSAAAPKAIKNKADLRQANRAVQSLPISKDLNPDQLNGNVQALL